VTTAGKPRLLIITTTFPRWPDDPGPAPFVFHHARAMLEHFQVTVLAPHFAGAARDEEMEGVRVRRFRYAWPERLELLSDGAGILSNMRQSVGARAAAPALLASELAAIRTELRRGYDFVNSHWLVPSGLLATLAAPARVRHVITVHAADYDLLARLPGGRAMIRYMARRAHAMVCVSGRLADGVRMATAAARIVVQPMGVDMELFRFDEGARRKWRQKIGAQDEPLILFAGKLTKKKGVDVLLKAAAEMAREGKAFRLAIAGDGAERPALARLMSELRLEDRVVFLGALPNRELAGLYSAAEAVVVPSVRDPRGETEGMPVVVLEALAAGRPVIASRLCSVPADLIGHGAVEVEEGNAPELARAIVSTLAGGAGVDPAAVGAHDIKAVALGYRGIFLEGA